MRASSGIASRDPHLLFRDRLLEVGDHARDRRRNVTWGVIHGLLAGVEPRQPQQVGDQPLHPRRLPVNDAQKSLPRLFIVGVVNQRFGVALDGGQRRAQFVRDVGDEVAADLIRVLQVGDVVQHKHRAAALGHHRGNAPDQRAIAVQRQRQLDAFGGPARHGARDLLDDGRMTDGFDVGTAAGLALELQQVARSFVHELQPPLAVDDQHAFDHAGEDGLHARAVAGERVHPLPQFMHGGIHGARDAAEVIVAVIGSRAAQVAQRVAPCHRLHRAGPRLAGGLVAREQEIRHDRYAGRAERRREEQGSDHGALGAGSTSL